MLFLIICFNNIVKAQSENISFQEIKNNVTRISESFIEPSNSPGDYLAITLEDNGKRWFFFSWSKLDGLSGVEKDNSMKIAVKLLDAVYKNYNYNKEKPISKIKFINALNHKEIIGIKTKTKNNIYYLEWQELIDKGYL